MLLINISLFLLVSAIFIAVYQPKSNKDIWLYSIFVPIVLLFIDTMYCRITMGTIPSFTYVLGSAIGECLVSMVISFIVLFVYLKKKLKAGDQFIYPKGLIVAIIVLLIIGLISEWGYHKISTCE